ncbi:MAG TPA: sugar phosphate isomerase/epimerase, partial [Gemmatimonadaceae bacterium]|nr:sugar phosphate isomerase/epimerase [Gemmatimonadaceae bacterium]
MPNSSAAPPRLGLDVYSLRFLDWDPFAVLEFCAARRVRVVHFSEPRLLGGLDRAHLQRVRDRADALGLDIEIGMLAIAPTSGIFDPAAGTAEDQLARMIDAAATMRSPLIRCVVGNSVDRRTPGGIERHIDAALQVLSNVRSRVVDAGLKLAIENHSGDMQSRELKVVIEEAGTDFVGACIDSGNAAWALEDPHAVLETLAPHVLTSHMRDSAVWISPEGVVVEWTRMGEGTVDIDRYMRAYAEQCPGCAISLELITNRQRAFNFRDRAFWEAYPAMPASD